MFELCELRANDFDEFRLLSVQFLRFESFFFEFCKIFALAVFPGTLYVISTKIHLQYVELFSNSVDCKYQLVKSIQWVVILLSISWPVNKLVIKESLLTSRMVSVVIGLEFTIASILTSNVCNDSSSKLFPCVLTKAFRIPLAVLICLSHVTCRRGIVFPGNPICSVHLQILVYSTVVHVLEGFPQFFNSLKLLSLSGLIC